MEHGGAQGAAPAAPKLGLEVWKKRIDAARRRREKYETLWAYYARLHTNAYLATQQKNEDILVTLPSGDQVKAGLVFRNIEQTLALLEVPEIGVRATATDYTRELGAGDTHREAVVEQALWRSLMRSGLIKDAEESDPAKRDGTIVGHGIVYSWWRVVEREIVVARVPVLVEDEAGGFAPETDEMGIEAFEPVTQRAVTWEGVQDEHISPLEFLFDASAKRLDRAGWHGFERPVPIEELRADPRYTIPPEVSGTSYRRRDLYGAEDEDDLIEGAVLVIPVWDARNQELITFIETRGHDTWSAQVSRARGRATPPATDLLAIAVEPWPLTFEHPDASPFSFYVPIPANDHPFGISQIEHVRNQAVEADKLRTRQANMTRQLRRVVWYNKNRTDGKQVEDALNASDGNIKAVGLDIQDNEKPEQIFGELPLPTIHPEIYRQYTVAEADVDKTSGVSDVPGGGADTATEAEHIFEIGNARAKRKKRLYLKLLTAVAKRHRDFLKEFAPEGETIIVPDVSGRPITLAYGRAAFDGEFEIEVIAGGGAMSLSPVKQKMLLEATNLLMGKFGPMFDRVYLRQLLTMFDFRDVNELMRAAMAAAGGAPGSVPLDAVTPAEYTGPQTLRAGINAPNEG